MEKETNDLVSMKKELDFTRAGLKEAEDAAYKMEQINKSLNDEISDLKLKIKFLELNCKVKFQLGQLQARS